MSKRSDGLVANMLGNRWRSSTVVAGTSAAVSCPAVPDSQTRPHLETLWYSIQNWSAGAGLQTSVAVQVRGAGLTVFAQVQHVVASSTVANVSIQNMMLPGKRGQQMTVAMNTAVGSVTCAINAVGWLEDVNG